MLQFNNSYIKSIKELEKQQSLLTYYESSGIQQAKEIQNTATLAFRNGEIGYIEFTALLSQSIDIKNEYLSALTNYNLAVIQINYFINQ
jgi:heavy metal efflux system protein